MRIVIFWDSITEGFFDYKKGGWANRLKIDFWKKFPYEFDVMNYGISAYTSDHVVKNFKSFFNAVSKRQAWKEKESILIVAIGINDSARYVSDKRKKQVPSLKFKENLEKIASYISVEKLIKEVVFIGATPVNEKKSNKDDEEFWYYNSDIESYNTIIKHFCEIHNYHYIEVADTVKKADLKIDGLHPSSKWHKKIYKVIKKYLLKNIIPWLK